MEVKYLNSTRQHLLDHDIPNRPCSKIWALCKKFIPFLAQNLSKVPMGGNTINIGKDRIMGQSPIIDMPGTQCIISHFNNMGLSFLSQFSKWDDQSQICTSWQFPKVPAHLEADLNNLQSHLYGLALFKKDNIDEF